MPSVPLTHEERERFTQDFTINTNVNPEFIYAEKIKNLVEANFIPVELAEFWEVSVKDYVYAFASGEIPVKTPSCIVSHPNDDFRANVFHQMGQKAGYFAKITKTVASRIADYIGPDSVVLDPLAGLGYFTKALREQGIATIGTDLKVSYHSEKSSDEIEKLDAISSLMKYGDKITHVIISWAPPSNYKYDEIDDSNSIDSQIIQYVIHNLPNVSIIHVGEGYGGCTGSDEALDMLNQVFDAVEDNFGYSSVSGIYDRLTIFNRVDD